MPSHTCSDTHTPTPDVPSHTCSDYKTLQQCIHTVTLQHTVTLCNTATHCNVTPQHTYTNTWVGLATQATMLSQTCMGEDVICDCLRCCHSEPPFFKRIPAHTISHTYSNFSLYREFKSLTLEEYFTPTNTQKWAHTRGCPY